MLWYINITWCVSSNVQRFLFPSVSVSNNSMAPSTTLSASVKPVSLVHDKSPSDTTLLSVQPVWPTSTILAPSVNPTFDISIPTSSHHPRETYIMYFYQRLFSLLYLLSPLSLIWHHLLVQFISLLICLLLITMYLLLMFSKFLLMLSVKTRANSWIFKPKACKYCYYFWAYTLARGYGYSWVVWCHEKEFDDLVGSDTCKLVPIPIGHKVVPCKWVYQWNF